MKDFIIRKLKSNHHLLYIASWLYSIPSIIKIKGSIKNKIVLKGAFLKSTRIKINGKNNEIIISPENRLKNCLLHISANHASIEIGKHCLLSNIELWIEDNKSSIKIGYRTTMEGGHVAATEGKHISIGEDCMFSNDIIIRNGDSHSIFDKIKEIRINKAESINIGNHVWLGADVKILKGVSIADGSIIATGAIVTENVEKNSIYAGIPAKKIKNSIYWLRNRI